MAERTDVGTVDDMHASATKLTGLDDFGVDDDNYREALGVLLESYQRDANLTGLGSKMNRFFLRGALVARLFSESAWKQYPQHADVAVERPIFVTGLPRTGTTILHRLLGADPVAGIDLLVQTGMGEVVMPEVGGMQMAIDEHHQHKDVYQHSLTVLRQAIALEDDGPDLVLRWSALLHDIGKPATRRHEADGGVSFHHHEVVGAKMVRKRLRALKYSKQMVDDISHLVYLHLRFHGYGGGKWTDSAVRRYVTDAGPLLPRLHKLVRADCTTRNKRRAARLQANYDQLEARITELTAQEDLARVRPDLDGNQIMQLLDIPAGPQVGEAWRFLKELRLDRGPLTDDEARAELLAWWRSRGNG